MRYLIAIVSVVVVIGVLVGVKGAQIGKLIGFGKQMEHDGPPPETVATTTSEEQAWEATIPAVGNVASGKGVAISTDTPGVVTRISFDSGQTVKQGQVLVELDASVERAQLASAVARKDLATQNIGRTRALAGKGVLCPRRSTPMSRRSARRPPRSKASKLRSRRRRSARRSRASSEFAQ